MPLIAMLVLPALLVPPTYYIIRGDKLLVRSGLLVHVTIDIASIRCLAPTHTWLSAPAWSLNRLAVSYNGHDSSITSPADEEDFTARLQRINPAIQCQEN